MGRFRHEQPAQQPPVTSDGLYRLQRALEAQIVAAGAGGVLQFNGRTGNVSLLDADIISALGFTPASSTTGIMPISVIDLPLADSAEPLLRWLFTDGVEFTGGSVSSGVAATGTPAILIKKNGAANGTISSAGVVTFTDLVYDPGDIFELYPPASTDATWDRVAITLETT
jgi:hypothetical protein